MSFWNKLKSLITPKPSKVDDEIVPVAIEAVVEVEKAIKAKEEATKEVEVEVVSFDMDFVTKANKFKNGLPKNKKTYFSKLVKEYKKAEQGDVKDKAKSKVEKYMEKNSK